jgi:hypothetical protein
MAMAAEREMPAVQWIITLPPELACCALQVRVRVPCRTCQEEIQMHTLYRRNVRETQRGSSTMPFPTVPQQQQQRDTCRKAPIAVRDIAHTRTL